MPELELPPALANDLGPKLPDTGCGHWKTAGKGKLFPLYLAMRNIPAWPQPQNSVLSFQASN